MGLVETYTRLLVIGLLTNMLMSLCKNSETIIVYKTKTDFSFLEDLKYMYCFCTYLLAFLCTGILTIRCFLQEHQGNAFIFTTLNS